MYKLMLLFTIAMLSAWSTHAQHVLTGKVRNSQTGETVPAVSVKARNTPYGDYTNDQGNFRFTLRAPFPVTLVFSSVGYGTKEVLVSSAGAIDVQLNPASILGTEVVVSASRNIQRKIESPVTIERIDNKDVMNSPQPSYYSMLQGLKGVDITTSSLTFTTITTRGFNTSGNTNFTQVVDGMDNQAPGLNFPLGAAIGLTELDVDNLELLSGASSALYGSRGLNGTLVMTGKDPFKYQGLSFQITQGVNHIKKGKGNDPMGASPYYDWTLRWAKKVNDRLAFKVNVQYTKAKDWLAADTSNTNSMGSKYTDPNYNGVNSYGSKTSVDINPFLEAIKAMDPSTAPIVDPLLASPTNFVSRTGYPEYGYLSNDAKMLKFNGEVRYNIKPGLQAIVSGTYGEGTAVYSNDTRYALDGFKLAQYRAELRAENWFVRAYTTRENSGNTIIASPTAQLVNEAWKPSYDGSTGDGWYPQYTVALITALATGQSLTDAHNTARATADIGRPLAGSDHFNRLRDSISAIPTSKGGTLFLDRSKLYNAEFQYNFTKFVKWAEVIAGLNYRLYKLDSKGTLFPDYNGPINVAEYSAFAHFSKKMIDNKLKLGAAFRFDKNTLFDRPRTTSRLSAVFETTKEHFLRFSYQNAYSFPSNIQSLQSTLVDYNTYASGGSARLLYGEYKFDQYQPYLLESVNKYRQTNDPSVLVKFEPKDIKPQSVDAFELGYSALVAKRVLIDVLGYYSTWKNFIGYVNVANMPGSNDVEDFKDRDKYIAYNIAFNGAQKVNTYGYAASVSVDLSRNFGARVNFSSDFLKNRNNSQINNFNTPNWKINAEFGNSGLGKKQLFSFNTSLRYRPAYFYSIGFASGTIDANVVLDAQVSYKLPKIKSRIKLGGTNLTNKYYYTGFGSPGIGGVYYITYAYNVF